MNKIICFMVFALALFSGCAKDSKSASSDFMFVKGGTFMMGNDEEEAEAPRHKEKVSDFYMCIHEVTQGEFESFIKIKNKRYEGDNLPVDETSWRFALIYCNLRSEKEGLKPCYSKNEEGRIVCDFRANGYRLPTEAEWEYAARGGRKSKEYRYSGSDDADEVAWHAVVVGGKSHIGDKRDVMTKKPNELGIYDMSGSVAELCWDEYASYDKNKEEDDLYVKVFTQRVLRGGSFTRTEAQCTNTARNYCDEGSPAGFRLVRTTMK